METSEKYKDFIIDYYTITGTTVIRDRYGFDVKHFFKLGELKGNQEAKKHIDYIINKNITL